MYSTGAESLWGTLTFGQGFGTGFKAALVAGAVAAVAVFIYAEWIHPQFLTLLNNADPAHPVHLTPGLFALYALVSYIIFGALSAVIGGLLFQKKAAEKV